MGIRNDIDESDRDLNRDMYPNRTRSNRFNLDEASADGDLGGHRRGLFSRSYAHWKDDFRPRNDADDYADYTPKDIHGTGKIFFGKGPKNYVRPSERIQDDIYHIYTRDRNLDASFIDIEVIGDEVHLEGQVNTRLERWLAEDLAAEVPGVGKVINRIKIRS